MAVCANCRAAPAGERSSVCDPCASALDAMVVRGARLIASRDPLLAQVRMGVEPVWDAAVDAWCDEVNAARRAVVGEVRGGSQVSPQVGAPRAGRVAVSRRGC